MEKGRNDERRMTNDEGNRGGECNTNIFLYTYSAVADNPERRLSAKEYFYNRKCFGAGIEMNSK